MFTLEVVSHCAQVDGLRTATNVLLKKFGVEGGIDLKVCSLSYFSFSMPTQLFVWLVDCEAWVRASGWRPCHFARADREDIDTHQSG